MSLFDRSKKIIVRFLKPSKEPPLISFKNMITLLAAPIFFSTFNAFAEVKSEITSYKDQNVTLEGQWVYDSNQAKPRPAVLIIHQWMGPSAHETAQAKKLADLGYVAFVADIYGKDIRPKDSKEAGKLATQYKSDVQLFRKRIKAAIDFISQNKKVDPKNIVVIGYCFGGTGALEAARAGFPIVGAVSFHGGLSTPKPSDTKSISTKLLILHGAIDPYVSPKEVEDFFKEMNGVKADYQFISYSQAVHAFTQKSAGTDISQGAAYNEAADQRSWQAFKRFLQEVAPLEAP